MTAITDADSAELIAELRRRIDDAEDTLRAIRDGKVDALIMREGTDDEVFTIEGDPHPYRVFMENMDPGAAAVDAAGLLLYANPPLCGLLRRELLDLQGKPLDTFFDPTGAAEIRRLIGRHDDGKQTAELRIPGPGADFFYIASAMPMRLGTVRGHALTFTDVTQRVRAEAAERSERAARAIIASANEAVLVCDLNGIITHSNAAASTIYDGDPVGKRFHDAIPLLFPRATGPMSAEDMIAMAVAGSAVRGVEAVAPDAPKVKDYLISAAPLQSGENPSSGCVIAMVDLSQRKDAEKQQLLLMDELKHRVRNTLALVLSICTRTLTSEETLQGFQTSFTGRIRALAATHTMLAEKSWTSIPIRDVIVAEASPYVGASAGRVLTTGLENAVAPRAAIALGLIFHELTTNAVKYGALSREAGLVTVRAVGSSDDNSFQLEWVEKGGPKVAPPTRTGFGGTVIARSLSYSPNGGAEIEFCPAGIVCRIRVPGEDVHRS